MAAAGKSTSSLQIEECDFTKLTLSFQSYNVGNYKCVFLKVNDDIDESIESKLKLYSEWYGTNDSPTTDFFTFFSCINYHLTVKYKTKNLSAK